MPIHLMADIAATRHHVDILYEATSHNDMPRNAALSMATTYLDSGDACIHNGNDEVARHALTRALEFVARGTVKGAL